MDVSNPSDHCPCLTAASEIGSSFMQGKMPNKSQGVLKNQPSESSQPSVASAHIATSISRPPSNYSNRSQEAIGSMKGITTAYYCMILLLL